MKHVPPSARETAFNCPHCGALAKQFWYAVQADERPAKSPLPVIIDSHNQEDWVFPEIEDPETRKSLDDWTAKMSTGLPFLDSSRSGHYSLQLLQNVNVARCFNCDDISLWIYDRLLYPRRGEAPLANPDLPAEIRDDYNEASSILELSPRGAAALIRLCIQKLCKHLGQKGKDINEDIAALVAGGLDTRVQKMLDVVRVIGNNAVHPGRIDLKDDRATAVALFGLLNLIAEKTISEPKHVDELYKSLPAGVLGAIQKRDGKV